jgi:unsaturated chondroitin disaccharide hydrolase
MSISDDFRRRLEQVVELANSQLRRTVASWPASKPAPVHTRDGRWFRPGDLWTDWTPGFLAGQMWILHGLTGEAYWREQAETYSRALALRRFDRDVHDLGFVFLSSYGRWRNFVAGDDPLRELLTDTLVTAGTVQSFRWNGNGPHGFIYSFCGPQSLFIDIMMNVRILFWAHQHGASEEVGRRAVEHSRTSARYLVRRAGPGLGDEDGSVAHEAIFNTDRGRGEFRCLSTQQGYSPFTCWARGLAWAMYGFAEAHRYTGDAEFLEVAERAASYYVRHTPEDGVPCWDYGAPEIPREPVDSSAAAVAACGLLLLARQVGDSPGSKAAEYRRMALTIGETLTRDDYLGARQPGEEGILLHGVYHRPRGWGVDASVMWGDYFFLELVERLLAG